MPTSAQIPLVRLFSFLEQKLASKAQKTCYFAYFSGQWGQPLPHPPLATLLPVVHSSKNLTIIFGIFCSHFGAAGAKKFAKYKELPHIQFCPTFTFERVSDLTCKGKGGAKNRASERNFVGVRRLKITIAFRRKLGEDQKKGLRRKSD